MPDLSHPNDPFDEYEETPEEEVARETIKQKAGLWALGAVAALTAIFGIVQIRNHIVKPLIPDYDANGNESVIASITNADAKKIEELHAKDTDADGLTDYDELYVYDTSPYLKDSDSDSKDDKTELENGENPNCPIGQTCGEVRSATNQVGNTNTQTTTADLDAIRNTLKNAGAPADAVDGLTDQELITLYNETVVATGYQVDQSGNLQAINSNSNTNGSAAAAEVFTNLGQVEDPLSSLSSLSDEDIQTLLNLSPDDIRALLIKSGGDESIINSYDDETLQAVFFQAVIDATGGTPTSTDSNTNTGTGNTNSNINK